MKCNAAASYFDIFESHSPINSPVSLHSSQLTRNRMYSQESGVPTTLQSFIPSAPSLFVLVLFYSVKT